MREVSRPGMAELIESTGPSTRSVSCARRRVWGHSRHGRRAVEDFEYERNGGNAVHDVCVLVGRLQLMAPD